MDNKELKRLSLKLMSDRLEYISTLDYEIWTTDMATFVKEALKTFGQAAMFDDGTEAELGDEKTKATRRRAQKLALGFLEFLNELGVESWNSSHATWVKEIQKITIEEDIQERLFDYSALTDEELTAQLETISASRENGRGNLLSGGDVETGKPVLLTAPGPAAH